MVPADQRLDADQGLVVQREEGLVKEEQLSVLDGAAQFGLETAGQGTDALAGIEDPVAVAARFFSLVHHRVSVADQVPGLGEGIAGDHDPNAAGEGEVSPVVHIRGADPLHDAARR